jgi:hypothetical protein
MLMLPDGPCQHAARSLLRYKSKGLVENLDPPLSCKTGLWRDKSPVT